MANYDKKGNRPLFLDRSRERKMANLSLESLPLGFRFSPTDEELINHYLRLKNEGHNSEVQVIAEVDFYKFDPWELPGTLFIFSRLILCFSEYLSSSVLFKENLFSGVFSAFICIWIFILFLGLNSDLSAIKLGNEQWFFFCEFQIASRLNRITESGYWKGTGKDRPIKSGKSGPSNSSFIGSKKTLVYHTGRAPNGELTSWVVHEYRAIDTPQPQVCFSRNKNFSLEGQEKR